MWFDGFSLFLNRSGLERPNIDGDIPVGKIEQGNYCQEEYQALAVAWEDGGKRPLRLNTSQDR